MTPDDRAFTDAIAAAPGDDTRRLVYADWLDERGDPRGTYLRAEVAYHKQQAADAEARLRECLASVDPVWAASVSRPPYGIAVPGLTFTDTGRPLPPDFLARTESHLGCPFPPDYAAFLTRYNGGTPNRSAFMFVEAAGYRDVRFFSSETTLDGDGPVPHRSAFDIYEGYRDADTNPAYLRQIVLIADVTAPGADHHDRFYLGLYVGNPPDNHRIVDLWDVHNVGLSTPELCGVESFAELLALLCDD